MRYILFLAVMLWGCGEDKTPSATEKRTINPLATKAFKMTRQINLTIFLDLSDRVDPKKNPNQPEHFERDSTLISYLIDYFIGQMELKGAYLAKGKMRVIFSPNPPDPGINQAATKLSVDLSRMNVEEKKSIYDRYQKTVAKNISSIYSTTIQQAVWPGSDIWRFFKNDVEIAIDPDSTYRNLLVIFTDGYLYHAGSKDKDGNRYAYILPDLFDTYKLRNDKHWADKMDKLDFGLISKRSDLDQLEILVLEITPSEKHKNDEDIIRKIIDKWFAEMKVKKWRIINSDLPGITKQKIERFLQE